MIDLYTAPTPNGHKISIFLEETGLPYRVHAIDLARGEQRSAEFTAICPNQKIPAIVDHDVADGPVSIFESGAILLHLAERTGRFLPADAPGRAAVFQWLMFQMSHVGPILGQTHHFASQAAERVGYAIERFLGESLRILGVLDRQLEASPHLAGDYSIADVATYPWIEAAWGPLAETMPAEVAKLSGLRRWLDEVGARPAVQRGMAVPRS